MIAFIDKYRDRFSVEFICTTLNEVREGGDLSPHEDTGTLKHAWPVPER